MLLLEAQIHLRIRLGRLDVALDTHLCLSAKLVRISRNTIVLFHQIENVLLQRLILLHGSLVEEHILGVHERHVEPVSVGETPADAGGPVRNALFNRRDGALQRDGVECVEDDVGLIAAVDVSWHLVEEDHETQPVKRLARLRDAKNVMRRGGARSADCLEGRGEAFP